MPATSNSVRSPTSSRTSMTKSTEFRESPFLPASIDLHGFIYDVQNGKLMEVSLPEEEIMAEYANPDSLVSTEWVAENMRDPKVRLVEVDVDTAAYDTGHLLRVPWAGTGRPTSRRRSSVTSQTKRVLEKLLSRAGVDKNAAFVLYGDNSNWFAAYCSGCSSITASTTRS